MTMDMYAENVLDHYNNPKNFGEMKDPDIESEELNPLCGDKYRFQLKVSDGVIKDVRFSGEGCAISKASASMISEHVKGKSLSEVKSMKKEDVFKVIGIKVTPARINCALLSLKVLKKCVEKLDV